MVSYGAGGATDFQARIVTMVAGNEEYLGQPMVILNKPGAGGRVGWNWFASEAEADGYTLAAYNIPHFIAQSIEGGVNYGRDSFEPIANWGADPAVVVVPTDSPHQSIEDLVAFATENPGKVTLSGAGLYVGHHIAALQIEKATEARMAYIPTAGGGGRGDEGGHRRRRGRRDQQPLRRLPRAGGRQREGARRRRSRAQRVPAGRADAHGVRHRRRQRLGQLPRRHGAEGHARGRDRDARREGARDVRQDDRVAKQMQRRRLADAHHEPRRGDSRCGRRARRR